MSLRSRIMKNLGLVRERVVPQPRARSFAGADFTRLTEEWSRLATLRSADEEMRGNLSMLVARSRELARNNSYWQKYLNIMVANVIGPQGIRIRPRVRLTNLKGKPVDPTLSKQVNASIVEQHKDWATRPITIDGTMTLQDVRELAAHTAAQDGEVILRLWRGLDLNGHGLSVQFLDCDTLDRRFSRNPAPNLNEVRMGIEVDKYGRPVQYWFRARPNYGGGGEGSGDRYAVPARDIIHHFKRKRVNQARGVPWCHSIMLSVKMLDGYEDAELVAARIGASTMGTLETTSDVATMNSGSGPTEMAFNPGTFLPLPEGWKANFLKPEHPVAAFGAFVTQQLRKIATGMGAGAFYNQLANDATSISYSTWRGFKLAEYDDWRMMQQWWVNGFERPLYDAWVEMAVLAGKVVTTNRFDLVALKLCDFMPRGWAWVDPLRDGQANLLEVTNCMNSLQRVLADQGVTLDEILDDQKEAIEKAAERGLTLTFTPTGQVFLQSATMAEDAATTAADVTATPDENGAGLNGSAKKNGHLAGVRLLSTTR